MTATPMGGAEIRYDLIDDAAYLHAVGAALGIDEREQERYAAIRRLSKALRLASLAALLGLAAVAGATGRVPGRGALAGALAVFLVDYAVYRYRAARSRRAFVHHLLLHKRAGGIERKFLAEVYDRDFPEEERRGLYRADEAFFERPGVPLNFPLRVHLVRGLIPRLGVAGRRLLDVGVLFGYFSELYLNAGNRVVSLDIYVRARGPAPPPARQRVRHGQRADDAAPGRGVRLRELPRGRRARRRPAGSTAGGRARPGPGRPVPPHDG